MKRGHKLTVQNEPHYIYGNPYIQLRHSPYPNRQSLLVLKDISEGIRHVAKLDLVIFGASSFVGSILTRYIAEQYGLGKDLKWAIAGRSEPKLRKVRGSLADYLGPDAGQLEIILANAADPAELKALCERTRVVVSTVGPYALYGEPLIKACVENGTDYCDLTGEPLWIRRMLDKYEAQAKENKARIVHCCGFDSIPSDMGVWHQQKLAMDESGKPLYKVDMRVKAAKGGLSGGTFASMMQMVEEVLADPDIHKPELADPYSLCPDDHEFNVHQKTFYLPTADESSRRWAIPFIMAAINTRVVHRSNALLEQAWGDKFQYSEAMLTGQGIKGFLLGYAMAFGMGVFLLTAYTAPGRRLLNRFLLPKPGQGPSRKAQENGFFDIRFYGYGGTGKVLKTKVTGDKDPGYGFTARMLGEAAACLALDFHNRGQKKGAKGGFWTPSSLMGEQLFERLQTKAGMVFERIDD